MKNFLFLVCALVAVGTAAAQSFTMMTYNIRYDNPSDAPYNWDARKPAVEKMLKKEKPSILGLQEALYKQVLFFDSVLENYGRVGVGRDDGKAAGEFSALYYDKSRFALKDSSTFWLSETPAQPSMGWDAVCRRVVSWAKLQDLKTGKTLYVFNTHFDHIGKNARMNSAKLLIDRIREIAGDNGAIVSGDLNATSDDQPIRYMLTQDILKSSRDCADVKKGPEVTYHDYGKTDGGVIDYIMVSSKLDVQENRIIDDRVDGMFLSDHNPMLAKLRWAK